MAANFEVGTRVKVEVADLPYAGTVVTYNDDSIYQVSVDGLGQVLPFEESEIQSL